MRHPLFVGKTCLNRLVLAVVCTVVVPGEWVSVMGQTTHQVVLDGMMFMPAETTVDVGDTVLWVWMGGIHDVESGTSGAPIGNGMFTSGDPVLSPNTFEWLFDQAFIDANTTPGGVYPYYCSVHFGFGMTGTITVIRQGDLDRNGRIDLADHKMLRACLTGPTAGTPIDHCSQEHREAADINDDGGVDLKDVAAFQRVFEG